MAATDTVAIKLYKNSDNDKRVGINVLKTTSSLSYNLQINGTANISGALSAGSLSLTTALPVASGGTGRTTLTGSNSLRSDLGFGTGTGALAVANGGTGKTTAADAWTALGGGASGKHADSYFALASHDHTRVGTSTIWLYPNNSNEINFGGTSTSTTLYFGYRATDDRPLPTTYIFGNSSNGTATIKAATFVGSLTGNVTGSATGLKSLATSSNRLTSADQDPGNCNLNWFHATSSMTTNKPISDGMILNLGWDNSAPSWTAQLYIANGKYAAGLRFRDSATWQPWVPLVLGTHENNTDYWGLSLNGSEAGYLRMPASGIIPNTNGTAGSGHGNIGTQYWYWSQAYVDNIYGKLNGNATGLVDALNSSKTITAQYSGSGLASTSWFCVWNGYRIDPMDASHMRSSLGLITTSPTTGIGTTETTVTSDAGDFSAFIASGVPGNSATSTCFIPKSTITSTAQEWQLTDEAHYIVFSLRISGSTLYAKVLRTNNGTKTISIAGLKGA